MTAEQLNKMQEDSRKRHRLPFFNMGIIVPKEKPRTYAEAIEETPKTFSEIIDKHYEFYDGELKPKKQKRKEVKKEFNVDLMAAQLSLPCTSEKKEEIPVIKKEEPVMKKPSRGYLKIHSKPHVPDPVQKKEIIRSRVLMPDPPSQKWERPKAVYSNIPSPYGIASELLSEQLKKSG